MSFEGVFAFDGALPARGKADRGCGCSVLFRMDVKHHEKKNLKFLGIESLNKRTVLRTDYYNVSTSYISTMDTNY